MNWIPIYAIALLLIILSIVLGISYKKKSLFVFEKLSHIETKTTVFNFLTSFNSNEKYKEIETAEINSDYTNVYDETYNVFKLSSNFKNSTTITSIGLISYELGKSIAIQKNQKLFKFKNIVSSLYVISSILFVPILIFCAIFGLAFNFLNASNIILLTAMAIYIPLFSLNLYLLSFNKIIVNHAKDALIDSNLFNTSEINNLFETLEAKIDADFSNIFTSLFYFLSFYNPKKIFEK